MAVRNPKIQFLRFLCICTALILLKMKVHSVVADEGTGLLCNEDLTSFLPALYSDSSRFTCKPLWHETGDIWSNKYSIDDLKRNHGILGTIGWEVLLPTGAIIARYYKHREPLWYYLHISIQFVGFVFGLAAVVAGKVLYGKLHANVSAHRGIGIFVLVLSILQVMALCIPPDKVSKIRKYWNQYHHWFGRFALFFGALNIALGIQNGGIGNFWVIGYWVLVAVLLIIVFILEVLLRMGISQETVSPAAFQMNPLE